MQAGRDAEKDLAMCEAATPGPWELEPEEEEDEDEGLVIWRKVEEHPGRLEGVIVLHPDCHYEKADVDFITEAREALPYWIKRAMAAEQKLSSHDPDGRNYSNIEFVMMRDRALAAEAEIDRLKKSLHFLVTAVKTGYRAGYIDGDGFGDALMDEVSKITV